MFMDSVSLGFVVAVIVIVAVTVAATYTALTLGRAPPFQLVQVEDLSGNHSRSFDLGNVVDRAALLDQIKAASGGLR